MDPHKSTYPQIFNDIIAHFNIPPIDFRPLVDIYSPGSFPVEITYYYIHSYALLYHSYMSPLKTYLITLNSSIKSFYEDCIAILGFVNNHKRILEAFYRPSSVMVDIYIIYYAIKDGNKDTLYTLLSKKSFLNIPYVRAFCIWAIINNQHPMMTYICSLMDTIIEEYKTKSCMDSIFIKDNLFTGAKSVQDNGLLLGYFRPGHLTDSKGPWSTVPISLLSFIYTAIEYKNYETAEFLIKRYFPNCFINDIENRVFVVFRCLVAVIQCDEFSIFMTVINLPGFFDRYIYSIFDNNYLWGKMNPFNHAFIEELLKHGNEHYFNTYVDKLYTRLRKKSLRYYNFHVLLLLSKATKMDSVKHFNFLIKLLNTSEYTVNFKIVKEGSMHINTFDISIHSTSCLNSYLSHVGYVVPKTERGIIKSTYNALVSNLCTYITSEKQKDPPFEESITKFATHFLRLQPFVLFDDLFARELLLSAYTGGFTNLTRELVETYGVSIEVIMHDADRRIKQKYHTFQVMFSDAVRYILGLGIIPPSSIGVILNTIKGVDFKAALAFALEIYRRFIPDDNNLLQTFFSLRLGI